MESTNTNASAPRPDAACPAHADQQVTGACARCGGFLCARCVAAAAGPLCAACAARRPAPPVEVLPPREIINQGLAIVRRRWSQVLPAVLIQAAASGTLLANQVLHPLQRATPALQGVRVWRPELMNATLSVPALVVAVLSSLSAVFILQVFADDLRGVDRTPGARWSTGLRRVPAAAAVGVAVVVLRALGTLLCVLPGLAAWVLLVLAQPAVVIGGRGPLAALAESFRMVKGQLATVLYVEVVGGVWILLGIPAFMVCKALFKHLGMPGLIAGGAFDGLVVAAAMLPLYAMNTALYLRVRALHDAQSMRPPLHASAT